MPVYPCDKCGKPAEQITPAGYRCARCGLGWRDLTHIPARRIEISEAAELAAWDAVHRVRRYGVYPSAVGVSRISSAIQLAIDESKAKEASNG